MERKSHIFKSSCLLVMLMIFIFPYIQYKLDLLKSKPLKGAIVPLSMPGFNFPEWFNGSFQENTEKYLNENFGGRNSFVRLNNQILFSLFNKAKAKGVIVGKDEYLYESGYIDAYYGNDYAGDAHIDKKINKMIFLRDTFAKMNKSIVFVFSPSKARYFPQYIPDRYQKTNTTSNYTEYTRKLKLKNVDFIDINAYFGHIRDTSKFLLFPKLGIHWSLYGAVLAQDSILKYMEAITSKDLPDMHWKVEGPYRATEADYDLADGMNLMYRVRGPSMGYPTVRFDENTPKSDLRLLSVSDSFYWFFLGFHMADQFKANHYWYYNNEVFPSSEPNKSTYVKDLDLKSEIEKHDIFLIMSSEQALSKYGFGFIDEAYELYHH